MRFASDADFRTSAQSVLRALLEQVDSLEDDDVDANVAEGSLVVTFLSSGEGAGGTFMLSLQTPTHELWLSANLTAWHFRYQDGAWVERDTREPMTDVLARLFGEKLGTQVKLEL